MTSYANDTAATTATCHNKNDNATTNAANAGTEEQQPQQQRLHQQQHLLTPTNATTTTKDCNKKMSAITTATTTTAATAAIETPSLPPIIGNMDYDADDYSSDGHEKADTTPENIKKIDEIINVATETAAPPLTAAATDEAAAIQTPPKSPMSPRFAVNSSFVGLGAAIDESNAKFCLAKKQLCSEKDTLSKSSSNSSSGNSNSNNNSNNNNSNSNNSTKESNEPITRSNDSVGYRNDNRRAAAYSHGEYNAHNVNRRGADDADDDDDADDSASASASASSTTATTTTKQSLTFTIDSFDDKGNTDPATQAAQAARYKNMMERFQQRHRRGASLSKLEGGEQNGGAVRDRQQQTTTTNGGGVGKSATAGESISASATPTAELPKVRLRMRDRSTSRVRDASKRHSWSPRSSSSAAAMHQEPHHITTVTATATATTTTTAAEATRKSSAGRVTRLPPPAAAKGASNLVANRTQFTPRSTAMQLALQKVDFLCPEPPLADYKELAMEADDAASDAGTYTLDGDNYTEEQKDYMNIDRSALARAAAAAASRKAARPKDLAVNRTNRASNVLEVNYYHETPQQEQLPKQKLPRATTAPKAGKDSNELMLGAHQTAGAYLEQIKSRMLRNMSTTAGAGGAGGAGGGALGEGKLVANAAVGVPATQEERDDVGCFTSVTTSGVLAKQRALDTHPKLKRCTSLSTSQIDSSEYISNEVKLKQASQMAAAGGFTDHQKAEYRLNVFTTSGGGNKMDAKFAATRKLIATPPDTPTKEQMLSDTALLKTAQSKQDWIQEWARNARARSLANDATTHKQRQATTQELMTRSYNCAETLGAEGDSFIESIYSQQQQYAAKLNKSLADRYRLMASGDCDFASDPALNAHQDLVYKPPKSPSKIPSPMHSLGRARSASRTRASLQHVLAEASAVAASSDDYHLQKTAAAINNLQQSLSRKNSIKSPTHSNASPRHPAHMYAMGEGEASPQHSLGSSSVSYRRSPMHRRNLSHETNYSSGGRSARDALMTSSINEAQLHLLTSGEYVIKHVRRRKNSLDAGQEVQPSSPVKQYGATEATLSPLRRSSSFTTAKLQKQQQQQQQQQHQQQQAPPSHRQARPQFQNIYTPPAARHQYALAAAAQNNQNNVAALTKSASSNNFGQAYNDYDDNLSYYINDEDEMGTGGVYYSSGEEDEEEDDDEDDMTYYVQQQKQQQQHHHHHHQQQQQQQHQQQADAENVPLSNTRLNKVLLMRIERSKQRAAAGGHNVNTKPSSAPPGGKNAIVGGMACPNTPELPRRGIKSATQRVPAPMATRTARQSMPRDTSLNRLAQQVPSSLASAKKQLLHAAYGVPNPHTSKLNQRVQPKYMDISKYKPAQSNNFLRKNDAKSTLKQTPMAPVSDYMKRSPSASSMGLSRTDATRMSNRSVRSVQSSAMNSSTTSLGSNTARASSTARRDASVNKQKEAEMAMWKRRSTYDPMKAAAEDRRKKEEAKRFAVVNKQQLSDANDAPFESPRNSMEQEVAWTLGESSECGEEYYEEEDEDELLLVAVEDDVLDVGHDVNADADADADTDADADVGGADIQQPETGSDDGQLDDVFIDSLQQQQQQQQKVAQA